jgi:hypothetical protein
MEDRMKLDAAKRVFLEQLRAADDVLGVRRVLERYVPKPEAVKRINAQRLNLRQTAAFVNTMGYPIAHSNLCNILKGTIETPEKLLPILEQLADILDEKVPVKEG